MSFKPAMFYVYLLRSESSPEQTYIGLTDDLRARIAKHNEGGSPHTAKFRPWKLACYLAFPTRAQAADFEYQAWSDGASAKAARRPCIFPPDTQRVPRQFPLFRTFRPANAETCRMFVNPC